MVSSVDMDRIRRIRKCANERENVAIGAGSACREYGEPLNTVDAIRRAFSKMDAQIEKAARNGKVIVPLIHIADEIEPDDSKEEREQLGFVAYQHFWDRLVCENLQPRIFFIDSSSIGTKVFIEGVVSGDGFYISVTLPY